MSRTSRTDEERVIAYFRTAPLSVAEAVFNIINGEMKGRQRDEGNQPQARAITKKRKKRTRDREAEDRSATGWMAHKAWPGKSELADGEAGREK